MILLIDTSTRNASVGLVKNEHILKEINWVSQKNHSVELLPNIKELLNDEDIEVQNCAIESLGIIGGPIAKKMLLSLPSDLPEIKESLELALENLES